MPEISVLLSPIDEPLGEIITEALTRRGHNAHLGSSHDRPSDLVDADAAIVVWSRAAKTLARLHDDARAALQRGALIPVAVDASGVPSGFENPVPIDLSDWAGDDGDPRWRFILEEIELLIERRRFHEAASSDDTGDLYQEPCEPEEQFAPPPVYVEAEVVSAPVNHSYGRDVWVTTGAEDLPARERRTSRPSRFDPGLVAIGGLMGLCVLTGVAIFAAPFVAPPKPVDEPQFQQVRAVDDVSAAPTAQGELAPVNLSVLQLSPNEPVEADQDNSVEELSADGEVPVEDAPSPRSTLSVNSPTIRTIDPNADPLADLMASVALNSEQSTTALTETVDDMTSAQTALNVETLDDEPVDPINDASEVGQDYLRDCSECPPLVIAKAGTFEMGAAATETVGGPSERPRLEVRIEKDIAIGAHEVTRAQWRACVDAGGCRGYQPPTLAGDTSSHPVAMVSYEDAQAYAQWLSGKTGHLYRLPTEAEWEYAARAGTGGPFSFGPVIEPAQANFDARYPYGGAPGEPRGAAAPVGSYKANEFGLYDMHGNLWEWTSSCWTEAPGGLNGEGACALRVIKGGAFNTGGWRLRSAHRLAKNAAAREYDNGFRVVREMR